MNGAALPNPNSDDQVGMVSIRRATLADQPAIVEFIKQAYPGRWQFKVPERWQWQFAANPFRPDDRLPVMIAVESDGRVVGQSCAMYEPLSIGGRVIPAAWGVDSYVLPELRGQGVGFKLQQMNHEQNEVFMSLDMSPTNRRIKSKLGSVALGPVGVYYRRVHFEPYRQDGEPAASGLRRLVRLINRLPGINRLYPAVRNWLLAVQDRTWRAEVDPSIQIESVDQFTPEMDAFWQRVSAHFDAAIQRDSRYLNWKYVRQPFMQYRRLVARTAGQVSGYLIYRIGRPPEPNLAVIADLLANPHDEVVLKALLKQALTEMKTARARDVLAATSVPAYQALWLAAGFQRIHEAVPMFHSTNDLMCAAVENPALRWLFSKGDQDWDQYPLAR